jgi:type II secretory pathway pseudopilin PulG
LIEVMIALAILLIAAAIIYPNVFPPKRDTVPSESDVVERAKALAIARAETVRLTVSADGSWEITPASAHTEVLATGRLPEAPPAPISMRVTELGACLPSTEERAGGGIQVDAVSCSLSPIPYPLSPTR